MSSQPIVVGVDGSEQGTEALHWAAAEAKRRGLPLHVIHAWIWPLMHVPLGPAPGAPEGAGFQAQAEQILAEAEAEAARIAPELTRTSALVPGSPGPVLIRASREAALVVVGSRGIGGFAGLLVGSSAVTLAHDAACPVVVVRGTAAPDGPVLVGIGESAEDAPTLTLAFEAAASRGVPLVAAHAVEPPLALYGLSAGVNDLLEAEREAGASFLEQTLAPWRAKYPDVEVEARVLIGGPGGSMAAASEGAQLVVVGSRGLGGVRRALLGSTSSALLHHAACPVLIEPSRRLSED